MKRMIPVLALVAAGLFGTALLAADTANDVKWTEDYKAALEQAKKDKKMVLLDFTGSDWCGPCISLHDKVLSSPEFAKWAKERFVLVTLDYPSEKKQTDAVKKQNAELKDKYKIQGYPTVILLNAEEKEVARTLGYGGQVPAEWIATQEKELAKGTAK